MDKSNDYEYQDLILYSYCKNKNFVYIARILSWWLYQRLIQSLFLS